MHRIPRRSTAGPAFFSAASGSISRIVLTTAAFAISQSKPEAESCTSRSGRTAGWRQARTVICCRMNLRQDESHSTETAPKAICLRSCAENRVNESIFSDIIKNEKQAGTAESLSGLCLFYHLSKKSFTLMILGSVTDDSKKSLSPVRNKSAPASRTALKIGLSFASRIFSSVSVSSPVQVQSQWIGSFEKEGFQLNHPVWELLPERPVQLIHHIIADQRLTRRHQSLHQSSGHTSVREERRRDDEICVNHHLHCAFSLFWTS